jgi:predicted NBD/HSP70 family sugar kinase
MPNALHGGRPPLAPREILHGLLVAGPRLSLEELAGQINASLDSLRRYLGAPDKPGPMRQARLVDYDPEYGYVLGPGLGLVLAFAVGTEDLIAALVDAGGRAHCVEREAPIPRQMAGKPQVVLDRISTLAQRMLVRATEHGSSLLCEGVDGPDELRVIGATAAWPAAMNHDSMPAGGPISEAWQQRSFREHLHLALGLPLDRVHAINDANAGALTLAFEQDAPRPGAVMCVHMSTGIGLGIVHQAIPKPYRLPFVDCHLAGGRDNLAGEIGHCVLDPSFVAHLNTASKSASKRFGTMRPLDPKRPCDCSPEARGHIDAVVGAEAVLERLKLYEPGGSSIARLRELNSGALDAPLRQSALRDVGRCVGSVLVGAIVANDPVTVTLVGDLASEDVAFGMNEQFRNGNAPERARIYGGYEPDLVALRGAALAVLRGGLYRGFFDHVFPVRPLGADLSAPDDWEGWEAAPAGARSGATGARNSAWAYRPWRVTNDAVEAGESWKLAPESQPAP